MSANGKRANGSGRDKGSAPDFDRPWMEGFIAAYEDKRTIGGACRAVSVGRTTVHDARQRCEDFALAVDDAQKQILNDLEEEAMKRAVEGVEQPVFQGGKLVGTVRKMSDTLLIFMLKALDPAKYRERVEISGSLDVEREKSKRKSDEELDRDLGGIADG